MLILPTIFDNFRTLKDRTTKITVITNELSPAQFGEMGLLLQQFCFTAFKLEAFNQHEQEIIKDLNSDFEIEKKSPGQRLRAVLYRNYEQDNEGFNSFGSYYDSKMEKFINHCKSKLDDNRI